MMHYGGNYMGIVEETSKLTCHFNLFLNWEIEVTRSTVG
jgi:hypothetical protein